MTYDEKLESNEDIVEHLSANWGPETEMGYPVELKLDVELKWKDGKGYALSCWGDLVIRESEKLGLKAIRASGQCLDDAISAFRDCGLRCRMLEKVVPIWNKWHLNDTHAGTERQDEVLDKYKKEHPDWRYDYSEACKILKEHDLYEDKQYLVDGKPYKYGSKWLFREIPHEILLELVDALDETISIQKIREPKNKGGDND